MSEELLEQIEKYALEAGTKLEKARKSESTIEVPQEQLKTFLSHLVKDLNVRHLMTITGLDLGERFEVIYHFTQERDTLHVRTPISKTTPVTISVVDIVPGAILYEMEVHDMFGITFQGNPWMNRKLILPDNWPDDLPPPLLKSSKPPEIRKRLGLEAAKQ